MHPSAEIVEAFYAAQRRFYATGDAAGELRALLAVDVTWHVPGRSAIAGTYRGRNEVLRYFATRREIAGRTFRVTPRGMLAGAGRAVHFADGEAAIDGQPRSWRTAGIFRISGDQIAACWLLPFGQYQFSQIWAHPAHRPEPEGTCR